VKRSGKLEVRRLYFALCTVSAYNEELLIFLMDILNIIIHWLVASAAFLVTAYILPGVTVTSFGTAVIAAGLLGIINAVIRPILIFLTLPITVITMGLFLFVINALIILGISEIVEGFGVANFWWALLFSIILSLINSFFLSIVY